MKLTPASRVVVGHRIDLGDGWIVRVISTSRLAYTLVIDGVEQRVDQVCLNWLSDRGQTGGRVTGPHDGYQVVG